MPQTFQRASVVAQAAEFLRRLLQQGEWPERLPGERTLCDLLQVSRPTLRAALLILKQEGLIRVAAGRWTPTATLSGQSRGQAGANVVGLLNAVPAHGMAGWRPLLINELRRHLQDAGYQLLVHSDSHCYRRYTPRWLEQVVRQSRVDAWVLHWLTADAQRWFAERRIPALVLGTTHPGVALPCIDRDYRVICRHAVGVLLSRGHRRIGLVIRKSGLAGDLASEQGFYEGFQTTRHPDSAPVVLHHDESIRGVLDALLRDKSRPTALLVANPADVVTLMTSLMNAGLRLPQDISLISRDDEEFLAYVRPTLARYRWNVVTHARRLAREIIQLATTRTPVPRQIRIEANFQPGDTLSAIN